MNYYDKNGYIDMTKIIEMPQPFIFLLHGRGTGKTYGACKYLLEHPEDKFMFFRRTAEEAYTIANSDFSPFKPVTDDNPQFGQLYVGNMPHIKNIFGVWEGVLNDKGALSPNGEVKGFITSMLSVSKIRGFAGEDIKIGIFDEFIPERHVKRISGEGEAILNAYETINRNREIKGKPPFKLVFLSNAEKLAAPIFQTLGIMDKIDKMVMQGKTESIMNDRGIAVLKLKDSPISRKKAETALYKANQSNQFTAMALNNEFDTSYYLYVERQPLQEYVLIAQYEDVFIYRHKSQRKWYISRHKTGTPRQIYINEEFSTRKMKRELIPMFNAWLSGDISFEDYYCKLQLTNSL